MLTTQLGLGQGPIDNIFHGPRSILVVTNKKNKSLGERGRDHERYDFLLLADVQHLLDKRLDPNIVAATPSFSK
jgi:hypothetical protein